MRIRLSITRSEHARLQCRLLPYANLIEALEAAPADRPFITFWIDEDEQETVTFGAFRDRSHSQAAMLSDAGVKCGDRLVIIMPQGIPAMEVFVAGMMLGAVSALLAYPNHKVEASKYRSGLAGATANLRARFVVLDENFPREMLDYVTLGEGTTLLRAGRKQGSRASVSLRHAPIPGDSLAFIQHSAGTTGLQKGVALGHSAVLRQIGYLQQALRVDGASDRIYSWLPLYHDMGLIACFMLPMVCHVPLVMQSPLEWVMQPETMLQVISAHKCTLAWLPNFAFQFVARRTRLERFDSPPDLSSVRAFINCSEPVRAGSMHEFQKAFGRIGLKAGTLQSSYAMAENVFAVTQSKINAASGAGRLWVDGRAFRGNHRIVKVAEGTSGALCFVSSGQLLPHHQVRIVDESGADLPPGSVGEIVIKSDCLFSGYYNRADLTAQVLKDGWYRTGDLGFYLDGELFVVGRKKDLIIVAGENIYPQDIEEIAALHPAIHDGRVVAMGAYNPETGTEDVIVVAEVGDEVNLHAAAAIEQELRTSITRSMGLAVSTIYLKPPKWIVKSTAGKPARSATFEKLSKEHPELVTERWGERLE